MADIAAIAARLDAAASEARAIPQITGEAGDLPLADAYAIQRAAIDHRLARGALSGEVTRGEALAAIDAVAAALEIIDSRYENFRFALGDVIADNASSSAFVTGPWLAADTDVSDVAMTMRVDDAVAETGTSAAILGDPIRSLVAAARLAGAAGLVLQPGWTVMLGGATAAAAIGDARTVSLDAGHLGRVGFTIEGGAS